jgi:hypothetical protein
MGEIDKAGLLRSARVAPVVKAHFKRDFHCGGTAVGVEAALKSGRRDLDQAFGELNDRLMGESGQDHVLQGV